MATTKHQPPQHPLGPEERLAALQRRGAGLRQPRRGAVRALRHLDGQLFAEYCAALAKPDAPGHIFLSGTSFEEALHIHRFDGGLRVLLFAAIRAVELSLRAQWAYHPAAAHGPWFYTQPGLFKRGFAGRGKREWRHSRALAQLREAQLRDAHRDREESLVSSPAQRPHLPSGWEAPAWEVAGTMSFGQLARWYIHLRSPALRERIARTYDLSEAVLCSFLPYIVSVRNACAHHDQLYGRNFRLRHPKLPQRPGELREGRGPGGGRRVYGVLAFIAFMLRQIDAEEHREFVEGLQRLFGRYERADPRQLGFPCRWQQRPVWRP